MDSKRHAITTSVLMSVFLTLFALPQPALSEDDHRSS